MDLRPVGDEPTNCYALVAYIPDPLAAFLDELRRELVPGCRPRAHVTVLPPRPLTSPPDLASAQVSSILKEAEPFEVLLGGVEIFPVTDVVFLGLRSGRRELEEMHRQLNSGHLAFAEPFYYHPHITLAQELPPGAAPSVAEAAARRWREYRHHRGFLVETLCFVQGTTQKNWLDLSVHPLGSPQFSLR